MKIVTALALFVVMTTSAIASQFLEATATDNGDGTITWWFTVESLPEGSFLEMTITGQLHRRRCGRARAY